MENEMQERLRAEVAPVVRQANEMMIKSALGYETAAEFLREVKRAENRVKNHFAPMKQAAHAAWKAITAKESEMLAPINDAERTVKSVMRTWYDEQERLRIAEERRLQAEADARADAERKRLEREAARLKTPELKEERMAQAEAVVPVAVSVPTAAPKVTGQTVRKIWRARIVDEQAAVAALNQWPDRAAYVRLNEAELARFGARTKGAVPVAGVEFFEETSLGMSGR